MSDVVDQAIVSAMVTAREAGLSATEFLQAVTTAVTVYSTFHDAPDQVAFVCGDVPPEGEAHF